MLHRTYAECGIILDEAHKADLVYFLLKRADDYPGIEDWAQEIRHNSILRVSAKYNTIQIYFGGTNYPDDDDHDHVATPFRLDGTINPAAKPYSALRATATDKINIQKRPREGVFFIGNITLMLKYPYGCKGWARF